jgi:hypothetical protein
MIRHGVYLWEYAGGSFHVALRKSSVFRCSNYPAMASWTSTETGKVSIDWGRFGKYELNLVHDGQLEGSLCGDLKNWRRMTFARNFSDAELLVMAGRLCPLSILFKFIISIIIIIIFF